MGLYNQCSSVCSTGEIAGPGDHRCRQGWEDTATWCSMLLGSSRMCAHIIQKLPASAAVSEADSIMGLVQGVLPALPSALICAMGTCTEFGTPCRTRSRAVRLVAFTGQWGHARCVKAASMCVVMQGKELHAMV